MLRTSAIALVGTFVLACTNRPIALDDEAGATTSHAESGNETGTTSAPPLDLPPPVDACDVFAQDCPAGHKCTYDLSHASPLTVCAPVTGFQAPGDECEADDMGNDDCDASSMCLFDVDSWGQYVATCVPFCTGTAEAPECNSVGYWSQTSCSLHWTTGDSAGMAICDSYCDVFGEPCPAGEKCVAFSTEDSDWFDSQKCVPVLGDRKVGESCVYSGYLRSTDDCDASSFCYQTKPVDGELVGTCLPFCEGYPDAPVCPAGMFCPIHAEDNTFVCIPPCDPLAQDCDEGLGCYWANQMFECVYTAGGIPTGAPCGYINDCAPGNLCADAAALPSCAGAACCTKYCDLQGGDAGCVEQPGTACVAFFEQGMTPDGFEQVGVCILPG